MSFVVLGTLIRIPQLWQPMTGPFVFRLAQTGFGAREFARHGVDLWTSPLPVFGVVSNVPFEFPLFQAVARELMRLGLDSTQASRLAGLVCFQLVVVLWCALLSRWLGPWVAVGTVVLLELLPFGLLWGGAPLIDFLSVALGLVMVLALDRWLRGGAVHLLALGSGAAMLAFVVKITTGPVIGLLLLVSIALVVLEQGWRPSRRRALVALVAGPGLALIPLAVWTRHVDQVKAESPATSALTSGALKTWNFGTWAERMEISRWHLIFQRVSNEITGLGMISVGAAVVVALVLGSARHRVVMVGLLAGALAPVLIFFNLYWVHSYYLIAIFPLLCAIPAVGVAALSARFGGLRVVVPALGVLALLLLTTAFLPLGRQDIKDWVDPGPIAPIANAMRRVTPADAKIVLIGCDWSPAYFYQADRSGLMFRFQTPTQAWAENDIRDYDFIGQCDPAYLPQNYLPAGYRAEFIGPGGVFRIVPTS